MESPWRLHMRTVQNGLSAGPVATDTRGQYGAQYHHCGARIPKPATRLNAMLASPSRTRASACIGE